MRYTLKEIRMMQDSDICTHINQEKVKLAQYSGMNHTATRRHITNLTKFEQVADERKITHE